MDDMNTTQLDAATFLVEGRSLRCKNPECLYAVDLRKGRLMQAGDLCPRCASAQVEPIERMVDIVMRDGIGACDCPDYASHRTKTWRGFTTEQLKTEKNREACRCCHIKRARTFALDLLIRTHAAEQNGVHA